MREQEHKGCYTGAFGLGVFIIAGIIAISLQAWFLSRDDGLSSGAPAVMSLSPVVIDPPVASFATDVTAGVAPLTVTFVNTSTGQIDHVAWDFNSDGLIDSIGAHAESFTYPNAGTYTVSLRATNRAGSDTFSQVITVEPPASLPVANFVANVDVGEAPLSVTFMNTSTGSIEGLAWDFDGDGVVDNTVDTNPTYMFVNPGMYHTTLTVSDSQSSSTFTLTITVNDSQP